MIIPESIVEVGGFCLSQAVRPPHGETVVFFRPVNFVDYPVFRIVKWRISPLIQMPHSVDWDLWPLWRYVKPRKAK